MNYDQDEQDSRMAAEFHQEGLLHQLYIENILTDILFDEEFNKPLHYDNYIEYEGKINHA